MRMIPVGTQSVLWGVHAFWFHPITVWLAFCRVHRRIPALWETVGILFHDVGYWGCKTMDGEDGVNHPYRGAEIAGKVVGIFSRQRGWDVRALCLFHSSTFSKKCNVPPSELYLPDKCALLFDPKPFYLFRARLSGELTEYILNSPKKDAESWYTYYRASVEKKLKAHNNATKT